MGFFRAESFEKVKMIFQGLIRNTNIPEYKLHYNYSLIFAITLIATDVVLRKNRVDSYLEKKSTVLGWAIYSVLLFGLLAMSGIENLPFIYLQF